MRASRTSAAALGLWLTGLFAASAQQGVPAFPFPEGTFKDARKSAVIGLKFGDGPGETAYIGVDVPDDPKTGLPDRLFVAWPGKSPDVPPATITASRRQHWSEFEGLKWAGVRDGHEIEAVMSVVYRFGYPSYYNVSADVLVKKGGARHKYFLRLPEFKVAPYGKEIPVAPMFAPPAIKGRFTEGGRRIVATVKVGFWDILPLQGPPPMETALNVEAVDDKNRSVEKARIKTEPDQLRTKSEVWEHLFKRPKPGVPHRIRAAIHLGTLFGAAAFEETVTPVDLKL